MDLTRNQASGVILPCGRRGQIAWKQQRQMYNNYFFITDLPESKYYFLTLQFDPDGRIRQLLMDDNRPAGDRKVRSFSDREVYSIKTKGMNDFESEPVKSVTVSEISELSKEQSPGRFEWTEKKSQSKPKNSNPVNSASSKENGFIALRCPSCGAPLTYNKEDGTYNCTYCGVSFVMKEPPRKTPNDALNMARQEYEKERYSDARKYYALALKSRHTLRTGNSSPEIGELLGVCALAVVMLLELFGIRSYSQLTEMVFLSALIWTACLRRTRRKRAEIVQDKARTTKNQHRGTLSVRRVLP